MIAAKPKSTSGRGQGKRISPTAGHNGNGYTVIQLERILDRKRSKLDGLVKQQERLQKQLATVEDRITAIGGTRSESTRGRKIRKRPKNDRPLIAVVIDVLSQPDNKKGLKLKELADAVLATGYKTFSDKFVNTLYQCVYNNNDKLAHDAKTHTYRVK